MNERDVISLTLLVATDEDGEPVVCGAWDSNLLDIIDADEVDALFAKARNQWLPDYVQWREARVDVDREQIVGLFASPTLKAEVRRDPRPRGYCFGTTASHWTGFEHEVCNQPDCRPDPEDETKLLCWWMLDARREARDG